MKEIRRIIPSLDVHESVVIPAVRRFDRSLIIHVVTAGPGEALTGVGFPVIRQVLLGIPEDFEYRPAVFA